MVLPRSLGQVRARYWPRAPGGGVPGARGRPPDGEGVGLGSGGSRHWRRVEGGAPGARHWPRAAGEARVTARAPGGAGRV